MYSNVHIIFACRNFIGLKMGWVICTHEHWLKLRAEKKPPVYYSNLTSKKIPLNSLNWGYYSKLHLFLLNIWSFSLVPLSYGIYESTNFGNLWKESSFSHQFLASWNTIRDRMIEKFELRRMHLQPLYLPPRSRKHGDMCIWNSKRWWRNVAKGNHNNLCSVSMHDLA